MGLIQRTGLGWLLNVKEKPSLVLAFVGGLVVFGGGMAVKPMVTLDAEGSAWVDAKLCEWVPQQAGEHAARLTKDEAQKLAFLGTACEGGWEKCQGEALNRYGIDDEDAARAVALYQEGCDRGDARGCTNLGWMYRTGTGVAADAARAVSLYQEGCDGGSARGCTNLGLMYERGTGVSADAARAVSLYQEGCDGGDAWGCGYLGVMYETGNGVAQDVAEARRLYEGACAAGHDWSCDRLKALGDE